MREDGRGDWSHCIREDLPISRRIFRKLLYIQFQRIIRRKIGEVAETLVHTAEVVETLAEVVETMVGVVETLRYQMSTELLVVEIRLEVACFWLAQTRNYWMLKKL